MDTVTEPERTLWVSDNGRWKIVRADDGIVVSMSTGAAVTVWRPRFKEPYRKKGKRVKHRIDWGRSDILAPVPYVERVVREKLIWIESQG